MSMPPTPTKIKSPPKTLEDRQKQAEEDHVERIRTALKKEMD